MNGNTLRGRIRQRVERRRTPPVAACEQQPTATEAPNSLQSQSTHHASGGRRERLHSNHAETKQRATATGNTNPGSGTRERRHSIHAEIKRATATINKSREARKSSAREEAAKKWVSDSTPPSPGKRKRAVDDPLGLPSLASPLGSRPIATSKSQQQQDIQVQQLQSKTNTNSRISETKDTSGDSNSGHSDSIFLTAQKTALQCVDYASKRQAAAKAALNATFKISSSLKDLVSDSNLALTVARQSRIEAENAAVRAEGAAKKVKEASDLAVKDKQRASMELDEANAQAEEAREFLRRVKGTSRGYKKQGSQVKTKADTTIPARIGTIVEVSENSGASDCSTVANHPLSPTKRARSPPSRMDIKKQKGENDSARGKINWEELSQSQSTIPNLQGASSNQDTLIEPIKQFKGHTSPVTQIAAVDQNHFISSSWDTTIRMWNATTGECIRTFRGHSDWVHAVSVLDSKHFISGSDDRSIKMWNVDSEECIQTFKGHSSFVKALAPMDSDRFLSGSRDRTIKLFSVSRGECLKTFQGHMDVVSAIVALDSNHFASGSYDNNIKYWNDSSETCVRTLVGHTGSIKTLAAVSEKEIISGSDDKTIRLWNVSTGKCLREFGSKNALVFSVTYICEGFFLSCGGNSIKLYHIPSGSCVKSYETPRISLAVVRLDDERFVTGSDQLLHLWRF